MDANDKKSLLLVLGGKVKPEETMTGEDMTEQDELKTEAGNDLLEAIESKDGLAVCHAIKRILSLDDYTETEE